MLEVKKGGQGKVKVHFLQKKNCSLGPLITVQVWQGRAIEILTSQPTFQWTPFREGYFLRMKVL